MKRLGAEQKNERTKPTHIQLIGNSFSNWRIVVGYELSQYADDVEAEVGRMTEDVSANVQDKDLRFRLVVDSIQDYSIYMLDIQGQVTTWNSGAARNKGYASSEILGRHFSRFFLPEDIAADVPEHLLAEAAANGRFEGEGWRVRKDGSRFWASVVISTMHDDNGILVGYAKVTRDLTERRLHEETLLSREAALLAEKERLQVTLDSIADGVVCTDELGNITLLNPAAEEMTGWNQSQAYGRPIEEILHIVDMASGITVGNPVRRCFLEKTTIRLRDGAALIARTGSSRDIQDSAAPILTADGSIIGAVMVFQDVTPLRSIQRESEFNNAHDALTSLPNRKAFESRLEETIQGTRKTGLESTVCFINIDRFKVINDTAGHSAGDLLLKTVSQLLTRSVRGSDLVVRLGGDEFAIVLFGCDEDRAEGTLTNIREWIEKLLFRWEDRQFRITASVGVVALTPASTVPGVMQQGGVACHAARQAGGNRISIYRPGLSDGHERHLELQAAADIRDAISEDRFTLFAQKIVSTGELQIPRFELLLRMIGRDGGIVLPAHFIPAAERFELMADVDRWVVKRVLQHHAERLRAIPDVQLSINLSGNSLNDPKFLPFFLDALKRSVLPPTALTLEITETSLINNLLRAGVIIEKLRSVGCKIALDDFGIGLSSFSYLRNFKVDFIKIDGSFVRDITHSAIDLAIVKAINNIAHEIHSQTVAEFVEDESIMEMVRGLGVDFAQGYGLGRPEPIETILARGTGSSGVDGAPIGRCFLDRDLRFVSINQQLANMNGAPVDDHMGRTSKEMIPRLYPRVERYLLRALQGEATDDVLVCKPANDPEIADRKVVCSYHPAFDEAGGVIGVSVAVVDLEAGTWAHEPPSDSWPVLRSLRTHADQEHSRERGVLSNVGDGE